MIQPSDSLSVYLKTLGYRGAVNDMLYEYLIDVNGLAFGSISLNDLIYRTLVAWGYSGTLQDMVAAFLRATDGAGLANYPRTLFANNEQGAWYDPSDFSTLFQDSAGTTPVTALGQGVGLMLDKRLGLVLGPELVTNGDGASTAGWWTGTSTVASVGGELVVTSTLNSDPRIFQSLNVVAGRTYRISVTMRAGASNALAKSARFRVGSSNGGGTIYAGPYQVDTNGISKTVTAVFTAGVSPVFLLLEVASNIAYANSGDVAHFDNISVRELPGNHAYQTSAPSRPTIQQDSNGMFYLACDGADDGMVTNSINFTGTDKMTVWAGVRKLSDAARGSICELSTIFTNPGSFALEAPSSTAGNNVLFASTGTNISTANAPSVLAPISLVVSCAGDISGDIARIRLNGVTIATTTTDQGTSNYGNYPLYLFRRGGTMLPFNGSLYGLIVRGAASNASQIAAGEAYMNGKTRAY